MSNSQVGILEKEEVVNKTNHSPEDEKIFLEIKNGDFQNTGKLESISDEAADYLSRTKGYLNLHSLKSLSDVAAGSLSRHVGGLNLNGLIELSSNVAENLAKHEGDIWLKNLAPLSDADIKYFYERSKIKGGGLWLSDAVKAQIEKNN